MPESIQDGLPLEVAGFGDIVDPAEQLAQLGAQDRLNLRRRPEEVLAFLSFAVGVLGSVKGPARRRHLPAQISDRLLDHLPEPVVARQAPPVQVEPDEQRVVVEHLLEVRHQPAGVHRIAVEAATQVIVEPAGRHLPERMNHQIERIPILGPVVVAQQEIQRRRRRELRPVAEAPVDRVVEEGEVPDRPVKQVGAERLAGRPRGADPSQPDSHPFDVRPDVGGPTVVSLRDAHQDLRKGRQVVAGHGREVGTAVERLLIRRQKDSERPPTAAPSEDLDRLLVEIVQVRPLLPIHLDVHEPLVHQPGDIGVLEAFVCHDVAPVTGRVADG